MNYRWKVKELIKKDFENKKDVIFKIFWEKIGEDDNGNIGTASGATLLNIDNLDYNEFVDYEDLTEELILDWILLTITETYDKRLNKRILDDIEKTTNPSVKVSEFPWSN